MRKPLVVALLLMCFWAFFVRVGLHYYNDHSLHSIQLWPSEFLLITMSFVGVSVIFLHKKGHVPFSSSLARCLAVSLAVFFITLEMKTFFWTPGYPLGRGTVNGTTFIARHSYNMGWQDGDWENVYIFTEVELRESQGIGSSRTEGSRPIMDIDPGRGVCDSEGNCEGTFVSAPVNAEFSEKGIKLEFADNSVRNYPLPANTKYLSEPIQMNYPFLNESE